MGPGGPDWPGGPFKPCSPFRNIEQTINSSSVFNYSSLLFTPHSFTYSWSGDPSETLRTLLPRVTLTTYWPRLPNGTLYTPSSLKGVEISRSLRSSDSSNEDVVGRVLTLTPFRPFFPSFPGFPKWPCQVHNLKTRQPEPVLPVRLYTDVRWNKIKASQSRGGGCLTSESTIFSRLNST